MTVPRNRRGSTGKGAIMQLIGKKAFVTAAGQGIGRAIAERLIKDGAEVIATDLDAALLDGLGAHSMALDVLDKGALTQAIETAQPDILVNAAGFVHVGTIADATDDEFDMAMRLNVQSQFHAMQAALPGMIARGTGSIINIASVASSLIGVRNRFLYSMSKAAVIGMTKSVAIDHITQGIRCNCICPGTVDSPSMHDRVRATGDYDKAMAEFIARQPMGRVGAPEEIAALAAYLASDESAFTTGQAHVIDGGWTLG